MLRNKKLAGEINGGSFAVYRLATRMPICMWLVVAMNLGWEDSRYQDRLYRDDGKGGFQKATEALANEMATLNLSVVI